MLPRKRSPENLPPLASFCLEYVWGHVIHTGVVLLASLWSHGLEPTRFLCRWNSPGKDTGVGSHSLLQGILPTQGSSPGLLHCRQILYHWVNQGSPHAVIVLHHGNPESLIVTFFFFFAASCVVLQFLFVLGFFPQLPSSACGVTPWCYVSHTFEIVFQGLDGSVIKALFFHHGGWRFHPWSGN